MSTPPRRQPALAPLLVLLTALLLALAAPPASADGRSEGQARKRTQRIDVQMLPGIRHNGAAAAASSAAQAVVDAALQPGTAGRTVRLDQRIGSTWRPVTTEVTDDEGHVQFFVASNTTAAYRVVALPWRSFPALRSDRVATWGAPDFVDEFDGLALGPAWEHRIQFYNPWGGRACSKGDPAAVAVGGGVLRLGSMVDPTRTDLCPATDASGQPLGSYPYRLNGHVSTQKSADFLYGFAAARMRFPRSLGQHAAFWLQPRGLLDTGPTPWGAEVDVVEWYGARRDQDVMASAVHEPLPSGDKRQIGGRIRNPDRFLATRSDTWWTRFHVFSVEWTPEEYIFRIGSHEVWRTDQGVSHVPEFLILSMLSSDFELPEVGTDPTSRTAEVDWVAFWQAH